MVFDRAGASPVAPTKQTQLFDIMQFLSAFKTIIPEFHAYSDDDKRYNIGATWTGGDGLRDYHNIELKYVHNSERLALQGDVQPDGSWKYIEPNGSVHFISAERAKHFMEQTQANAQIMCQMLDRLEKAGINFPTVDTQVQAV